MTIPKPRDITAYHQAAWAYLTVPYKRGLSQQARCKQPGSSKWEDATPQGGQWLLPMQQVGKTEFQARYTRPGEDGEWATGRVWMPEGFEVDGDRVKPEPPYGLKTSGIGGSAIRFDWAKPAVDPDNWRISWKREGQKHWSSKVVNRGEIEIIGDRYLFTIRDLASYVTYEIAVRAIVGGVDSDPADLVVLTTRRADDQFGPADPYNATADDVKATSATISWDQDDPRAVKAWYVGVPGHGPLEEVTDQEYTITALKPATGYTASVFARGFDEAYAAGSARVTFTTTGGQPSPYPKPPAGLRVVTADLGTGDATVEWADADDCHFWKVLLEGETRWRTARTNRYVFRRLDTTVVYGWRVKAVREDDEGIEFESAPTHGPEIRFDSEPKPKPEPPTGLHVHCKTDRSAKVEWDQADVDAWEIWVDDDRDTGAETTVTPLVRLKDLLPGETYTASVVAVNGHPGDPDYQESDPATITFTTLDTILPPEPPPPNDIGADLPAPEDLMVRSVNATVLEASWADERPSSDGKNFYIATVDGIHWERIEGSVVRFEDLQSGSHTVHVYGVFEKRLTGIARRAATMREAAA